MERKRLIQNTEDWWALWIGLAVFLLSLAPFGGRDLLAWGVATSVWLDIAKALAPVSKAYAGLPGVGALVLTSLFMPVIMGVGAKALRFDLKRFAAGFTVIFGVSSTFFPG